MKPITKIVLIVFLVLALLIWYLQPFRLCGQVLTPGEHRITGECKRFSTNCLSRIYKPSGRCSAILFLEGILSLSSNQSIYLEQCESSPQQVAALRRLNTSCQQRSDELLKMNQEVGIKNCQFLSEEDQQDLFTKHSISSCEEIEALLQP